MRRSISLPTEKKLPIPSIVIAVICAVVIVILCVLRERIWRICRHLVFRLVGRKPTRETIPHPMTAVSSPPPAFQQIMVTTNEGQTLTVVPVIPAPNSSQYSSHAATPISFQEQPDHRTISYNSRNAPLPMPPPPAVSRDSSSPNQTARLNGSFQRSSDSQTPHHRAEIHAEAPPVLLLRRPPLRLDTSGTIISTARLRASRITNRGGMTALPLYSPGPPSYGQSLILGT